MTWEAAQSGALNRSEGITRSLSPHVRLVKR